MIRFIKRKEIDIQKYDTCIKNSLQRRVYAFSWYLDVVADSWGILVLNDYKAVMPIPFMRAKKYLYVKKVIQPFFCQQLGVFSKTFLGELETDFYQNFVALQPKIYNFNSENTGVIFNDAFSIKKTNYELSLEKAYKSIAENYSKNLRRNIKKAINNNLQIQNISINELVSFKRKVSKYSLPKEELTKEILTKLVLKNKGKSYAVFKEKDLIAVVFLIFDKNRITYLMSGSNEIGKQTGAIAFFFDTLLKQYASKKIILDFEGSEITGIARFFKSFGAEKKEYINYQSKKQ